MSQTQELGKTLDFPSPQAAKVYLTETDNLTEPVTHSHHCQDAIRNTPRGSDAGILVDVGSRITAFASLAFILLGYNLSID